MTYKDRYRLIYTLLLAVLLAGGSKNVMAQVTVRGSVYGGGNQADVQVNTTVNMSIGTVEGNVYGGGNLGDVGNITKNTTDYNYSWKQTDGSTANVAEYNNNATATNTGICTVTISGGTIGQGTADEHHGNVFGGGKGEANTFWCEKGIVYATSVSISAGAVNGSVYGGGEVGRVEDDTKVAIGPNTGDGGPTIKGNVFGAGAGKKTHGYSALVRGNSVVVVQGGAKVEQNVYGGGMVATVGKFWVTGVDYPDALNAPTAPTDLPDGMPYAWRAGGVCRVLIKGSAEITGDVFGAGKGQEPDEFPTHFVSMTDPNDPQKTIKVEYYTTKEASEVGDIDSRMPKRMVNYEAYNETTKKGFKVDDKNITWVPYAYDDEDNPTIVWEYFDTPEKYHTFLQTLAIVDKPFTVINESAEVNGSVFGGSESGFVLDETSVSIQGGTIGTTTSGGDVFGGGKGLLSFAEAGRVRKNTNLTVTNGTILGNVYGGGSLGDVGTITKPADYNYIWKQTDGTNTNVGEYNNNATATNTGICTVTISGGTIGAQGKSTAEHASGHVFGAGKGSEETWWCEKAIAYATSVTVSAGMVYGNVYGGGQVGRVEDDAMVLIGETGASGDAAPDIKGDVFGAGAGLETHGYSALVRGNALVTVQGTAQIGGSVYGGGEIASVGKFEVVGGLPTKPKTGGTCIVNIKDNAKIGTSDTGHNVFGACKGVTPHYISSSYTDVYSMQTYENRPSNTPGDTWDYWKTYEEGYEGQKFIKRYYKSETEYLDFLKTLALTSNPHVTIGGTWSKSGDTETITASGSPSVYGSVYGGGQRGVTLGAVDVNMVGGTVEQDVYGGGALADTNLGNWDVNHYEEATSQNEGESITDLYIITGGTGTTADPYKYAKVTDGNATFSPGTYYRRVPTWAHTEGDAYYKTTVDLTGGTIKGDAYGGALGNSTIAANVYGEVKINLNENVSSSSRGCIVNRIFGANNTNGSPMGNVTVHVFATQNKDVTNKTTVSAKYVSDNVIDEALDDDDTTAGSLQQILADRILIANKLNISVSETIVGYSTAEVPTEGDALTTLKTNLKTSINTLTESINAPANADALNALIYDVQAVYGGGNQAAYNPVTPNSSTTSTPDGSQTKVIIEGCYVTSIETVYGGGNAAAVPETNVEIKAAYEILNVFGGGNGKDAPAPGVENLGADVGTLDYGETTYGTGNANSILEGGYIHEAYGGSNQKGIIKGSINQTSDPNASDCELVMSKVVGAGKYADIDGDVNMILACQPEKKIDLLFAGADEANVNGNITLTVTNGHFGKVFGGNNLGGAVKGKIVVNVEETGCRPIRIDELYLGGNEAAYSVYGYYESDEVHPVTGKKILKPRDSAADEHTPVSNPAADATHTFPYAQPELNIISCTYIGKVFGGGYGTGAALYGNPTVNINMIPGAYANSMTTPNKLGEIGTVYGGGNAADIIGNTYVNIGTAGTVGMNTEPTYLDASGYEYNSTTKKYEVPVVGAYITGNVYGGGKGEDDNFFCNKAMVGEDGKGVNADFTDNPNYEYGNTHVTIGNGTVTGNVYGGGEIGRVEKNTTVTIGIDLGDGKTSAPIIRGDVFGGGKGKKTHGYAALVRGNPTVIIQADAKVGHSVYGAGEIASVARYRVPRSTEDVAALIDEYPNAQIGMPIALLNSTCGYCTVTVKDNAEIGPDNMKMYHKDTNGDIPADDKPDDAGHVFAAGKGFLPEGNWAYNENDKTTMPRRMVLYDAEKFTSANQKYWEYVSPTDHNNVWEYFPNRDKYIEFIQTQALASNTEVSIEGNAFVKGSVYGGSENGLVQYDTKVYIKGGQIGCGVEETGAHPDSYWTTNSEDPTKFAECPSWTFEEPYAPYDPYAKYYDSTDKKYYYDSEHELGAAGGAIIASDGHTYYGNVFGGGSGSVPYFDTKEGISKYLNTAGTVKGNTTVEITGGHILTNVYGGCEATNVGGTATVKMTDGTIGVPRTDTQIQNHPLTGYIFGGGKGDQRVFFNKDTNVKDAVVKVEGGRVYGSVYGGGEDGHVLRNVTLTIGKQTTTTGENNEEVTTTSGPKIGTKGTSYYDGHVFGGGRGFGGEALTAGNVGGSVDLSILDGEILGSVYGGGRLASVGYGLYLVDEEVTIGGETVKPYGTMRPDDVYDNPSKPTSSTETAAQFFTKGRGHINMIISGGTIGNNDEYAYDANDQLAHTKGGNVFAGGMGRMYVLGSTTTPISSLDWWKLGCVKSTKLTISGDAVIKSCVYGGGELGQVVGAHTAKSAANADVNVGTEVIINDGTIGTEIKDGETVKYTFGSIFGGGYGSLIEELVHDANSNPKKVSYPKYIAGRVKAGTKVNMTNGTVWASVYGGGEMAAVGESVVLGETLTTGFTGDTHVIVSGGTIGKAPITLSGSNRRYFGGAKMGNVYGGGSGHNNTVRSGHIYGNTNVTISGTDTRIYHNVYGGGAYGTVGDFTYSTSLDEQTGTNKVDGISGRHEDHPTSGVARVTITGGTIGYDGKENGMVFGSSRGDINQPKERDDYTAWVYDTHVTIGESGQTGPQINGTVYGSGENGHTFNNTVVTVNSGTIGIETGAEITYTENGKSVTKGGAYYPYRGNVYGGGCGTDKYYSNHAEETQDGNGQLFNPMAGIVYGTTKVNIKGGKVVRNVYGAGAMGSVGTMTSTTTNGYSTLIFAGNTGKTTVAISGGTVGVDGDGNGNVFGAARGDVVSTQTDVALVKTTDVRISSAAIIKGNVYGGGEAGDVGTYYTITAEGPTKGDNIYPEDDTACGVSNVSVTGGTISGNVFGAGKGEANTFTCQKAMARSANVTISAGTIGKNVYGGGEVGRVEYNTVVTVGDGTNDGAGIANGTPTPVIGGNVFGAGAGVETHGYSALVRGNTTVTVQGNTKVGQNVYGGGMIASVGKYGLDNFQMPSILKGGGNCLVTIKGYAQVGPEDEGNVFGAGRGIVPNHKYGSGYEKKDWSKRMMTYSTAFVNGKTEGTDWDYITAYTDAEKNNANITKYIWDYLKTDDAYATYLETLALATAPNVTITGNASVNGDVYGGGERGISKGSVTVNINGGTIAKDVYGGGSLANTNIANWKKNKGEGDDPDYWSWDNTTDKTANHTTTVNLHGGTIGHNVYGGGLGSKDPDIPALVYGDVLVELNKNTATDNCVVKGVIHGANNYNGSPLGDVTVHVYKTVGWSEQAKDENGDPVFEEDGVTPVLISHTKSATKDDTTYDLKAVYGGGNEAAYDTESYYNFVDVVNSARRANVIIEGCADTSIETVYGGGNAASAPATYVLVKSCYEISKVFGGGNGLDDLEDGTMNPGANVGYRRSNYQYDTTKTREQNATAAAAAFDAQKSGLEYGSGVALAELWGGTVHSAFGGSNTLGNVRTSATVTLDEVDPDPTTGCPLCIGEIYGGGNEAEQDGTSNIELGCISYLKEIYGGSKNADINNDIALTIQSGRFNRVFGGNNLGGVIRGTITVNIEETGCHPIVIGQLYGGGNQAAYNVNNIPEAKRVTTTTADNYYMNYPKVNVKSFTRIGEIYGGGYGSSARVTGNPYVTINECVGSNSTIEMKTTTGHTDESLHTGETLTINSGQTDQVDIEMPLHKSGTIGAIGNVFGGGNAAPVSGNTNVIIGNLEYVDITTNIVVGTTDVRGYYTLSGSTFSLVTGDAAVPAVAGTTYYKQVVGADIRGNVYGGGNAAEVTGDTNVTIGKAPTE